MLKRDWLLIWAWLAYLAILGPFLVSERDWFLPPIGVSLFIALTYFTQKRIRQFIATRGKKE